MLGQLLAIKALLSINSQGGGRPKLGYKGRAFSWDCSILPLRPAKRMRMLRALIMENSQDLLDRNRTRCKHCLSESGATLLRFNESTGWATLNDADGKRKLSCSAISSLR